MARLPWPQVLSGMKWEQGEHITILGPTGCGKTHLAMALLPLRRFVVVLAAKPRDPLIGSLRASGFEVSRRWPPRSPAERIVLWPEIDRLDQVGAQAEVFARALADVYREGGWCLYGDEGLYLTQTLGLAPELSVLWQQGRTLGVSMVVAAQRPRHLPLAAYSQASHLWLFRTRDGYDARRFAEVGGTDPEQLRRVLDQLGKHDVAYVGPGGDMLVTRVTR